MSTRAMIGYMNDTKVTAIYSHWDGYPTGLGMNLLKFYGNPRRVLHLIEGGDVSAFDWNTGHANHYAFRSTWVSWNGIDKKWDNEWDRGGLDEKWEDVKPRLYEDMNTFLSESLTGETMIAYAYLFDWTGHNMDHSQLSKGRWRCFKSDYKTNIIHEIKLDKKKLIKGRKSKTGRFKEEIVDSWKVRNTVEMVR